MTHSNGKDAEIQKIDQFMVEEYARFLAKMKATPEGEGALLDNCMIMFGSGLGDGRKHIHHHLPVVLAGKAGGRLETGRHLAADEKTPIANLYLSMLQAAGCNVDEFGDSTGALKGLIS